MARARKVDPSPRLLPVGLDAQPGTFAHALHHMVDGLDLRGVDGKPLADRAQAHSGWWFGKAGVLQIAPAQGPG